MSSTSSPLTRYRVEFQSEVQINKSDTKWLQLICSPFLSLSLFFLPKMLLLLHLSVGLGYGGTDKNTGGGAEGGRGKMLGFFWGSDQEGQD